MYFGEYTIMSDVISIRISKKLKQELEELGIDYADKVRQYLEELVMRERRRKALEKIDALKKEIKGGRPFYEDIREDRDNR